VKDDTPTTMSDLLPVWRASLPYLRARKNDVHVPISYHLALELLKSHPGADGEIVQLAILLHDNGWARIDARDIAEKAFGPDMKTLLKSDVRRLHETIGMEMAQEILSGTGYAQPRIDAVVKIIDGHDSRTDWFSLEDALVKDADKLWRFTTTGVAVACDWFKYTPARYVQHLNESVRPSLITASAGALADAALIRARAELMTDILV
jgi:hypothetical protein